MARVSEFFYKESKSKYFLRGWRGMAWVSELCFFYKESKSKKKKEKNNFFSVVRGGGGGEVV